MEISIAEDQFRKCLDRQDWKSTDIDVEFEKLHNLRLSLIRGSSRISADPVVA